ncbi:MAG: hypothetical protein ACRDO2_10105, partial [Nocardioidaceae bacterium]
MSSDVAIMLLVASLTSLAAWPWSWPTRIRIAFAAVSVALLAVAAVMLTVDVLDGWSTTETVVVLAGALALAGGGPVTLAVFSLVDQESGDGITAAGEVLRGGAWIGALERAATFATLTAGWPEGVAIVLALKGLARYPELRADGSAGRHAVAERFIIGTFTSLLWAAG